jgi:hypothetical protein
MLSGVRISILALVVGATCLAQFNNGNQTVILELPRVSQRAVVTQRIGLTDITITYHRPQANGREVFGDLVWYDRLWRAGANDTTTIEFTHPVKFEGQELPAGRYGLFIVPRKTEWTIIFSKNSTSWGHFSYDPKEDALRVRVKPLESTSRDTLAYEFTDLGPESATIAVEWARVTAPIRLTVDTKNITLASLRNQLRHLPGYKAESWYEAALYCVDHRFNYAEALTWIDHAIAEEERFDNLELKSQILAGLGKEDESAALLAKALAMASPDQRFMYGERLLREKKLDEAEKTFTEITTKHPSVWRAWYGLAKVQVVRGDRKAAESSLQRALAVASSQGERAGLKRLLERLAAGQGIG